MSSLWVPPYPFPLGGADAVPCPSPCGDVTVAALVEPKVYKLGGRHSGYAASCLCADPCTHSVQDLNRLLYFRSFWGRGVAGASTAGRAPAHGHHRPAAARGLFAVRFTRLAAVAPPGDGGQGRASAPPRGSETPGKMHGRAHSEDT